MKLSRMIIKTKKNKHSYATPYLNSNEKASHFVNSIYYEDKKKELKEISAKLRKEIPVQKTDLITASVKKIIVLKQRLQIVATKKRPNLLKKIMIKKGKISSPTLMFTKDMSSARRTNRLKYDRDIVYLFAKYMEPKILVDYISKLLEVTKKHWPAITQINQLLKNINSNKNIVFRIGIFGRFNSTEKAKKIYFTSGNVRAQTFSKKVNFAYAQSRPSIGAIGVKMWTYW